MRKIIISEDNIDLGDHQEAHFDMGQAFQGIIEGNLEERSSWEELASQEPS
jgi:hypothetical protein